MIKTEHISSFFHSSTRGKNDVTNKLREKMLVFKPPKEWLEDIDYGRFWVRVQQEWNDSIKIIAEDADISFTKCKTLLKAGRGFHYDFDFMYYQGPKFVQTKKIEFKYIKKKINHRSPYIGDLPQFICLPAKYELFPYTFDRYWYKYGYDKYKACDPEIKQHKPRRDEYLKCVTNTNFTIHSAISELRAREKFFEEEKIDVVKSTITDYLTKYGHQINIPEFIEKVKSSQDGKIYLLWNDGTFYLDKFHEEEMRGLTFHSIKNGNTIVLKAGNTKTTYHLLLRWKNHRGILNPAWQISIKREL